MRVTVDASRFTVLGIVKVITPTESVIEATAVIFVLPATVTDVPELGTAKVTDEAGPAPITAADSLPTLPVKSFRVIFLAPQP